MISIKVLSLLVNKTTYRGYLSSFKEGGRALITHMLFTCNTLVFCGDSREQIMHLNNGFWCCLRYFLVSV